MHILAVDDEQSALNVLVGAIKDAVSDAEIHSFRKPLEALEYVKNNPCEIAFLDIQMREINGVVLARKIKEAYPQINIIFVTGYSEYANEAFGLHASGYVFKPVTEDKIKVEMENLRYPVKKDATGVFLQTFGEFRVFADGKEVSFGRSKAKEMLAYLVDQKGRAVGRKELAKILFEKEDYTRSLQNYLSKIIKELMWTLEKHGMQDVVVRGLNSYALNVESIRCDLYEYEKDDSTPDALNAFRGEYMEQYSWGELTLARLYWKNKQPN